MLELITNMSAFTAVSTYFLLFLALIKAITFEKYEISLGYPFLFFLLASSTSLFLPITMYNICLVGIVFIIATISMIDHKYKEVTGSFIFILYSISIYSFYDSGYKISSLVIIILTTFIVGRLFKAISTSELIVIPAVLLFMDSNVKVYLFIIMYVGLRLLQLIFNQIRSRDSANISNLVHVALGIVIAALSVK